MQQGIPSRTALRVALRRAAHQILDSPLVFTDPIAIPILGPEHGAELHRTPSNKPFSAAIRAFMVARSRYAEDQLARSVANGCTQYVLLGAGLDTFAYRNPWPSVQVYEVDHPDTQAWKRNLLADNNIPIPATTHYAPVDFEHHSLAEGLAATTFNPGLPTVFAWLGVVPYLTLEAFRSTLHYIAARPDGTGVIFDYSLPRESLPFTEQLMLDSLSARVQQAGEPFQLFFTPPQIAEELISSGLPTIEDLDSTAITARYFHNRTDGLQLRGKGGHILSAWK